MGPAWLFLLVANGVEIAVPNSAVYRLLHRDDPDFQSHLEGSLDLAAFLGTDKDSNLPGVVVLLASGQVWLVGDARMQGPQERVSYLTLRPELFADSRPWCRGVLVGEDRWAFVVEESAVA